MTATLVMPERLVSEQARKIFQWICYGIVCELVDIFGTITNIINIICFIKQGFKDSVNVSLLGLAISDLGCLVTLLFTNVCFIPAFQDSDVPFDTIDLQYLTTGWPHIMFTRVTSWITALITLERCLCITLPLKVKNILTPHRVIIIIVCIFVSFTAAFVPVYYANRFGMTFVPERNKTILTLVFTEDRAAIEHITFAINNVFLPFTSFVIIIVCTVTLVVKLRSKTKWREKCTATAMADPISGRDQKVTKMVVMISTLFISCFIPTCFTFVAILIEPGLHIEGPYRNTLFVLIGIGFLLESINSSTNIFIYYHMSSRYRAAFRQLFYLREAT